MNISGYVILENGVPNFWSISGNEQQAWDDFREWYSNAVEGTFRAAPEISELKTQGFQCIEITFTGNLVNNI